MNFEDFPLYYFISIGVSFLLTRLVYVLYLNSIGLEYNPNKEEKFLGSPVKKYYNIPKVVNTYLKTKNLDSQQKNILVGLKYWEYLNFSLLISFPFFIMIFWTIVY
jgi:hypothetical protein